jgi:uncharacterized protein YegP (UPF0339 family)
MKACQEAAKVMLEKMEANKETLGVEFEANQEIIKAMEGYHTQKSHRNGLPIFYRQSLKERRMRRLSGQLSTYLQTSN